MARSRANCANSFVFRKPDRRNALAETIDRLYKTGIINRRGPWRRLEAVEFATLEWIDGFNNRRLLEPIGNIRPAEAEARNCAQIEEQPQAT